MPTCPTCRTACEDGVAACPVDGTVLAPSDPLLGKILGDRYRLLGRIGEGGMGTVYRAEHVVLRKRLAVKVLRPELCKDEDLVRRFQQEAIAASQIGQENIVDVTDFGRTPQGALYFVMEQLEGVSLAVLLRDGPLPLVRAIPILGQICRALGAAHGRGIVHRDLKPDNVIVVRREDGSDLVKVVDFGIAQTGLRHQPERLTRAGTIIGTPEYMAPEQAAAASVDHRADIYAFGVVAYEVVTGQLPFHAESAVATLLEHQTRAPAPPSQLRPDLPPRIDAMVLKALAKRPEGRHQSMYEVATDLTAPLADLGFPPVYDRPPTPPPILLTGATRRMQALERPADPTPVRSGQPARTPVTAVRGATLELEPELPRPRPSTRRRLSRAAPRRGRLAVAGVLAVALLVAGAAAVAWRSAQARVVPVTGVPGPVATAERFAAPSGSSDPSPATPRPAGLAAARRTAPATAPATRPVAGSIARAADRKLGGGSGSGENPYRKLDDLKPDPF